MKIAKNEKKEKPQRRAKAAKVFAFILAVIMIAGWQPLGVKGAESEATGPSDGYCYIRVWKSEDVCTYLFYPMGEAEGEKIEKISGIAYNQKTNTLTIKNVKKPEWVLDINEMGTDFKIKVVGTNQLWGINVWGFNYGGSLEFYGTGTLTLNKAKTRSQAITMMAEQSKAVFKVGKYLNLYAYAGKDTGISVCIIDDTVNKASKAFVFSNGASIKKVKREKVKVVETSYVEVVTKYENGDSFSYMAQAISLEKQGSTEQFCAIEPLVSDEETGWKICKLTGEISEWELPIAEQIEIVEDYEEAGYKDKVLSYVYDYTYSGSLSLKAKK